MSQIPELELGCVYAYVTQTAIAITIVKMRTIAITAPTFTSSANKLKVTRINTQIMCVYVRQRSVFVIKTDDLALH